MLSNCGKTISAEVLFVIHQRDSLHQGTENDFLMVGKVELEVKIH